MNKLAPRIGVLDIEIEERDFRVFMNLDSSPEVIICMGDTLAHLESFDELDKLIRNIYDLLLNGGKLVVSFRDYSNALNGNARFIPVKSDPDRILTCILDYTVEKVTVTAQTNGGNKFGLSSPMASQNIQLLLNILHWLDGTID